MAYVTYRMIGLPGVGTFTNNAGRTYTGVAGVVQDIPEFDVMALTQHGWTKTTGCPCGPSGERPAKPMGGQDFLDTTLAKIITFNAPLGGWLDPAGGGAV